MIVLPIHTILGVLGSESKVHLFQSILFQEILHTRVKSHLARFHGCKGHRNAVYSSDGPCGHHGVRWLLNRMCDARSSS
jgi:hypothetical protein